MSIAFFRAVQATGIKAGAYYPFTSVHDASSGSIAWLCADNSLNYGFGYYIFRGFLTFNTSGLNGAVPTAARLILYPYGWGEIDPGYATLHIVEGIQHIPLIASDYGAHHDKIISGGSLTVEEFSSQGCCPLLGHAASVIPLNSTGLAWIKPSDITKLCLRLSSDINAQSPSGQSNTVNFGWSFSPYCGLNTAVTTVAATYIGKRYATLNGFHRCGTQWPFYLEVTYAGEYSPEYPRVRFNYGEYPDYSNNTVWQTGIPALTDFSQLLPPELKPNTCYRFRAEIQDAEGICYGSFLTFYTLADPPIVVTDPVTDISAEQATLHGTLVDDKGLACNCGFQWGLDTGYGEVTPTEVKVTGETFLQVIAALPPMPQWNLTTHRAYGGSHSIYCGNPDLFEYIDNQISTLPMKQAISLLDTSAPLLSFYIWPKIELNYDYVHVDISINGGSTWIEDIWTHTGEEAAWLAKVEIALSAYKAASVKIRFRFTSDGSVTYEGAYIDDVKIKDGATTIFSDDFESGSSKWNFTPVVEGWQMGVTYHVRAVATNAYGIGYGADVTFFYGIHYPSDTMARVSSIRRIYHPGLYRMEVALGDLGFDVDVAEAAIKKIVGAVEEPEISSGELPVIPPLPIGRELTPEERAKIIEALSKVTEAQKGLYPTPAEIPTVATKTTRLQVMPTVAPPKTPFVMPEALVATQVFSPVYIAQKIFGFIKGLFR